MKKNQGRQSKKWEENIIKDIDKDNLKK